MKRKPDKVSCTLSCPLEKGHSHIGSKRKRGRRGGKKESRTVLKHRLVRGVCGIMNSFPLGPSPAPRHIRMHARQRHVAENSHPAIDNPIK